MKIAPLAGLTALALAGAQAATPDAALALTLAGTGPYYTLGVDIQARQVSATPDLSDLRVRNGAGEALAFAWAEAPLPAAASQRVPARLYKVPPPAAASAVDAAPRQAWIVDTRQGKDDLLRLDLALEHGAQGVYTLRIEASDDLQHWRLVQEDAQLVQLQQLPQVGATSALATVAEREHLSSDGIDLDNLPARYLRLTTASRSAVPPLASATITRAAHRAPPPPLEWSAPIAPIQCEATSCDYALPRNVRLDAVQIAPADVDTIAQVTVLGHGDAARLPPPRHSLLRGSLHALRLKAERSAAEPVMAWDQAAIVSAYWLTQASGAPDLHSPPVHLDGQAWQALRLQTFGPISQLGHAAPTIRIGVRPRQLVFLARGTAPFVLARATAAETAGAMALAQLMPARAPDAALPEARATVTAPVATAGASAAPSPTAPPAATAPPSRTPWLWAALLAGLAAMGAMAWSLLRRPAASSGPPAG